MALRSTRWRAPAFILTFHPRFRADAVSELRDADPLCDHRDLERGLLLVEQRPGSATAPLDARFAAQPPVFIEHIAPVAVTATLTGSQSDLALLASLVAVEMGWRQHPSLAVECRKAAGSVTGSHDTAAYTCRDVEVATGTAIEAAGATIDLETPAAVIHILIERTAAHVGIADVRHTLRTRANPIGRASALRITRAEHKLTEALNAFAITVPPGARALDLGAAPGGWSMVLAERGALVTAVDPAELDPRAAGHPRVTHLRARAEQIVGNWPAESFDFVANDMARDPDDSAAVMAAVAYALRPGSDAVMTVKLATRNVKRWAHAAEEALGGSWEVVTARHLAANRQELTWHLRRTDQVVGKPQASDPAAHISPAP